MTVPPCYRVLYHWASPRVSCLIQQYGSDD